ncbi:hypothetical protein FQR65_LT13631 [Abscondita terminalis]|nr:hypothetical protein FQR65_LT13631 [Abscondita terminalis]
MSMLAEKRTKQKWLLNPQGKNWLAGSNKFGLKILESMGWKEGNGLGKQQDGITQPIRIAFKNDSKGLGLKETASSMQQDHFNALLESLNDNSDNPKVKKKISSLEEKSQNSRSRVHYKKFTRGKDISRYTSKDIASIFEKTTKRVDDAPVKDNSDPPCEINKGSMTDYFKKKAPKMHSDSEEEARFGLGFSGVTNPAFEPLGQGFTLQNKHVLDTITEESEVVNVKSVEEEEEVPKPKKRKKNKSCEDINKPEECITKVKKRKKGIDNPAMATSPEKEIGTKRKGIDNPAMQMSTEEEMRTKRKKTKVIDSSAMQMSPQEEKCTKRKKTKGIDNPAMQMSPEEGKYTEGIDNPVLDLMLNVVCEPVPVPKPKKKKGCDNYGFDIKAQKVEEKVFSIAKSLDRYQAEVENDINEIKDEELYVGEISNGDGENQRQKDGVLLRYKYASFTKDPHWAAKYNQTVNFAKKSYKHLIKGDIAVGFKKSNLHEIKGYGLGE